MYLLFVGGQIGVFIYQRMAHALGVLDINAEDYGFVEPVGLLQEFRYPFGHKLGAFVNYKGAVKSLVL